MKNKLSILILLLAVLCSCDALNPFEEEGEYIEKRIDLPSISGIQNNNIFKIILVEDDDEYVLLKGGENIISKVSIQINEQNVIIDHSHKNIFTNYDQIIAELHLKEFKKIATEAPSNYSTQGTISGDLLDIDVASASELVEMNLSLNYNSLDFHTYGSVAGGYEFKGVCTEAKYVLNGIINIKASQLQTSNTNLAQNGIGEAHIWVENKLNATIYTSGNIYYKGNPEITIKRVQVNNQSPTAKVIPE